jgi:hypothetical protein
VSQACERCGGPSFNVNRDGEATGRHLDLEECLREMNRRAGVLEDKVRAMVDRIGTLEKAAGRVGKRRAKRG